MDVVTDSAILTQVALGWLVVGLFVAALIMHRTALLGFTMFSAFGVLSSTHSGLLWSSLFGLDYAWVSPAHLVVFSYCGIGMLLFAIGAFVAWKPLRANAKKAPSGKKWAISGDFAPSWLTPQFVLLCMCIGAAGYILTPITTRIPTVHAIWTIFFDWLNIGILISALYSGVTGRYRIVGISLAIFLPLGLLRVVSDGHAGALGLFLVQFGLVFFMARKVRLPQLVMVALMGLFLAPVASTWFQVRDFIRSGSIQGNSVQRVLTFLDLFKMYYDPLSIDPHRMREVLFLRFDFTHIYAAQVEFQPEHQPYMHGKTFTENLLIILVPRILWPDKPVKFGGSEFVGRFTGMYQDPDSQVSVGTPVNLEFYANFGPWGAALLLGLYGYLCAKLEVSLFRSDFRDLPKLLRRFAYTAVACSASSNLALTVMKLIPGLVGIWMAGQVIEAMRKTLKVHQDFLTPLPEKKKRAVNIVTGEVRGREQDVADANSGEGSFGAWVSPITGARSRSASGRVTAYGFRPWFGPSGK